MRIGIDLGGSHIAVGLVENDKIIIKKEKSFSEKERKDIKKDIEKTIIIFIEEILNEADLKLNDIELIGIAAPGTHKGDIIVKAENLGITNFNLIEKLKKYFDYSKIYLRNDAKCAAICEKTYGNLKKYDDAVFICLGTGVGGAVFLNGKLLKSKNMAGFELRTCDIRKKWKEMYLWE